MQIVILIPVFNDFKSASKLIEEIDINIFNLNASFSVILINDASTEEKILESKNLAKQAKVFFETEGEELGKMEYIKGNEWIAGNISYHLPERPKWIYSSNEVQLCNKDMKCLTYKWNFN